MEVEMEALAALRLNLSPRRYRGSNRFNVEDETTSAPSSPYYLSAPTSPRVRGSLKGVEETPFGEVLAAVPFDWEERPGTPKRRRGSRRDGPDTVRDSSSSGEEEVTSPLSLCRQSSSKSEFDFGSSRIVSEDTAHGFRNDETPIASADQLFLHGQLLPLRLPPRLQAVKLLRESPTSSPHLDGDGVHFGSCRMAISPRSGISAMKQIMSFRARSKSPQRGPREAAVWPFQEVVESDTKRNFGTAGSKLQMVRSLSPLRIFKRERSEVSTMFSENSTPGSDSGGSSSSSAPSARSSAFSTSGDENGDVLVSREFWPSFEAEKQVRNGKTLNDFLFSDKPPTSPKIDVSKLSSKEVLSKAEQFKEKTGPIPHLSRSNARSISRTPIKLMQAQEPVLVVSTFKHREARSHIKRLGILKGCLGFLPPNPR